MKAGPQDGGNGDYASLDAAGSTDWPFCDRSTEWHFLRVFCRRQC